MKLEVGKYYRSRDGIIYGPLVASKLEDFPFAFASSAWKVNGKYLQDEETIGMDFIEEVLVTEKPKPKTGVSYLNVYEDNINCGHQTKQLADSRAGMNRLACVRVEWTEGQNDD